SVASLLPNNKNSQAVSIHGKSSGIKATGQMGSVSAPNLATNQGPDEQQAHIQSRSIAAGSWHSIYSKPKRSNPAGNT
ncbi:hypothetical protein ACLOJK_018783, partial [Asimina triloba]